jgi:hypothetical protein
MKIAEINKLFALGIVPDIFLFPEQAPLQGFQVDNGKQSEPIIEDDRETDDNTVER